MAENRSHAATALPAVDIGRLSALVRVKLVRKLLRRELPRLIAIAILRKLSQRAALRRQMEWLRLNEPVIEAYRKRLVKSMEGMHAETLQNSRKYSTRAYKGRVKADFDADQWLFDRAKWQAEMTPYGEHFAGQALDAGGQFAADDLGLGISFDQTDPRAIAWVQGNAKNAAFSITNTQYEELRRAIMAGLADGDTIAQIRDRIRDHLEVAKTRAEMIARTETLKASNRGALLSMQQSGVVEGKVWQATYDQRTCPMCAQLDGAEMGPLDKPFFEQGSNFTFDNPGENYEGPEIPEGGVTYKFDYEEIQHPPLHPDCRCTLLALFREGTMRAGAVARLTVNQVASELQKMGVKADLYGMDERLANEMLKAFRVLMAEYETSLVKLNLAVVPKSNWYAWVRAQYWMELSNKWHLGPGKFQKLKTSFMNDIKTKWHPVVDAGKESLALYYHEFAHTMMSTSVRDKVGVMVKELRAIKARYSRAMAKAKKKLTDAQRVISEGTYATDAELLAADARFNAAVDEMAAWKNTQYLSEYAEENLDEFWAEAFTSYKLNSNPPDVAKEVGEWAAKWFKKGGD